MTNPPCSKCNNPKIATKVTIPDSGDVFYYCEICTESEVHQMDPGSVLLETVGVSDDDS